MRHAPAHWRWIDAHGEGRNVHAYFRRDFALTTVPAAARLQLFAAARYLVLVNGVEVGAGPVRFRLNEPCYDTWELAPHLVRGRNTIAVHVQAYGPGAQIQDASPGVFNAWGEIRQGAKRIDLHGSTWLGRRAPGYDPDGEVFSFTSPAIDLLDARLDQADWCQVGADLTAWRPTVALARQDLFGTPIPRPIPHLTQDLRVARTLLGSYALADDEAVVAVRVPGRPGIPGGSWALLQTWIHSPRAQTVPIGLWWGEHFLNGQEIQRGPSLEGLINRNDAQLCLKAGWNSFFAKFGLVGYCWDFAMAVPIAAGLRFSAAGAAAAVAAPGADEPMTVLTAGPVAGDELTAWKAFSLPPDPASLPVVSGGWTQRAFEPAPTSPAISLAWCRLGERQALSDVVAWPLTITAPTTQFYDLGHQTLGRIVLDVEAPAGSVVDVGFSEHVAGPANRPAILERHMIFAAERLISAGGRTRFTSTAPRGFRYLQVKIIPAAPDATVVIHQLGAVQQIYPFDEVGSFRCSEPLLERIWAMGWRSLRMCAEDVYTDCPWRERLLYAGDFLVEMATTLAGNGDLRLIARCLELLAPSVEQPQAAGNDFSMIPMIILAWYRERGGDPAVVRRLFPRFAATLEARLATSRADGLFDVGNAFIDWIGSERDSCLAAFNAVMVGAMEAMARIATSLKAPRPQWTKRAARLRTLLRTRFWDEAAGAYRDGFMGDTPLPGHHLAASAWVGLFANATTTSQEKRLRAHYQAHLGNVFAGAPGSATSPYGGFHILGALYRAGHVDLAEQFMIEAWGSFIHAGWDTCGELFPARRVTPGGTVSYAPHNGWTMCHAWSSAPTFYLSSQVLGVDLGFPAPADPARLVIRPTSDGLSWASGVVPHPRGPVSVAWRREGQALVITCAVPKGVRWTVQPGGALAGLRLWINGADHGPHHP